MSINLDNKVIIDNETKTNEQISETKTNEKIQCLKEKSENCVEEKEALLILNKIEKKVSTGVDIDLALDKETSKYYYIANYGQKNESSLNIPISFDKLESFGDTLVKILNSDVQLGGDLYSRGILEDSWKLDGFEKVFIEFVRGNNEFSKNDIEEIFKFVMNSKGVDIEDWKVSSSVCKNNNPNNACKQDFGNK